MSPATRKICTFRNIKELFFFKKPKPSEGPYILYPNLGINTPKNFSTFSVTRKSKLMVECDSDSHISKWNHFWRMAELSKFGVCFSFLWSGIFPKEPHPGNSLAFECHNAHTPGIRWLLNATIHTFRALI